MAGMKKVAGTCSRSSRARILGMAVVAPYSALDTGPGSGFALCNVSLSTSTEIHTTTRAPLGHVLGVSFLPALTAATAVFMSSSLELIVMGGAPGDVVRESGACP